MVRVLVCCESAPLAVTHCAPEVGLWEVGGRGPAQSPAHQPCTIGTLGHHKQTRAPRNPSLLTFRINHAPCGKLCLMNWPITCETCYGGSVGKSTKPRSLWSLKGLQRKIAVSLTTPESAGGCRQQFTVTVGTIFADSHIPVGKWLLAYHPLCASKKGMSAHQLHRMLKVTYRSAWAHGAFVKGVIPHFSLDRSGFRIIVYTLFPEFRIMYMIFGS